MTADFLPRSDEQALADVVRLEFPADPTCVRLARLAVAAVASRLGFSYDEVDDLRTAIDELCFVLIGPHRRPGTVRLRLVAAAGALAVEGWAPDHGQAAAPTAFSGRILAATLDGYEIARDDGIIHFRCERSRTGG